MYIMYMSEFRQTRYSTVAQARAAFKHVLDDSARDVPVTINRDGYTAAVVPAERLRELLVRSVRAGVEVGREGDRYFALMPDRPFASDGATLAEALDDLADALREYAADWHDRLRQAPNHAGNWDLVQLVELSSDEQLREWLAA